MADLSSALEKFFSAASVKTEPFVGTILDVKLENVARQDQPEDVKPVVYFKEDSRGLAINKRRYTALESFFGSRDTDKWIGKRIRLVFDPNVTFKGQQVGGIALQKC